MRNQGAPFYLKDHFVYIAGAGQLPSVSLLPARDFLTKTELDLTTAFCGAPIMTCEWSRFSYCAIAKRDET
nr:unnamed protein product [Digitaria exilis]